MTKRSRGHGGRRGQKERAEIDAHRLVDSLSAAEAKDVLLALATREEKLREQIEAAVEDMLPKVDASDVAAEVQADLERLEPEDVWDRAGSQRGEYVDPGDAAADLLDEALAPFGNELDRDVARSRIKHAELNVRGLLQGIHDFHRDSPGDYKAWAGDYPMEYFRALLDEWIALPGRHTSVSDIRAFLQERCPTFAGWACTRLAARAARLER